MFLIYYTIMAYISSQKLNRRDSGLPQTYMATKLYIYLYVDKAVSGSTFVVESNNWLWIVNVNVHIIFYH